MLRSLARGPFLAFATPLVVCLAVFACSSKPAPNASRQDPSSAAAPPAPVLWGDMKPVVSVKELMRDMLDPAADNIFEAVKIVTTEKGMVERVPKTDQDWERIRI